MYSAGKKPEEGGGPAHYDEVYEEGSVCAKGSTLSAIYSVKESIYFRHFTKKCKGSRFQAFYSVKGSTFQK